LLLSTKAGSINLIGTHPIFYMVWLSILRGLSLGRIFTVISKVTTIFLRNSSDPIGFPLKLPNY